MRPESPHPIEILLVDDSPGDVRLTLEALTEARVRNRVHVVADGAAALAFLRQEGQYAGAARPDLILLDLNLPKKDGRELLAELRADELMQRIPVVVLTATSSDQEILGASNLHPNCYVSKPVGLKQLVEVVQAIGEFWLTVVKRPPV